MGDGPTHDAGKPGGPRDLHRCAPPTKKSARPNRMPDLWQQNSLVSQKFEQIQERQAENRKILALDLLEQLHTSALEPVSPDRPEHVRSLRREIAIEERIGEMAHPQSWFAYRMP